MLGQRYYFVSIFLFSLLFFLDTFFSSCLIWTLGSLTSWTFSPNFQVWYRFPASSMTTRSASRPGLNDPFFSEIPRRAAGCAVTHSTACATEQEVHLIKFRTHSSSVTALLLVSSFPKVEEDVPSSDSFLPFKMQIHPLLGNLLAIRPLISPIRQPQLGHRISH